MERLSTILTMYFCQTHLKTRFSMRLNRSFRQHLMDKTPVFSPMVRLARVKHSRWRDRPTLTNSLILKHKRYLIILASYQGQPFLSNKKLIGIENTSNNRFQLKLAHSRFIVRIFVIYYIGARIPISRGMSKSRMLDRSKPAWDRHG